MIGRFRTWAASGQPLYPLGVLWALNMVDEFDRSLFAVLAPNVQDHFGLDLTGLTTLIALAGVAIIFLELPLAYWADRGRRTRIVTFGASVWVLFAIGTGLAPSVLALGLARVGAGVGRSVVNPTHNSLLADYYDVDVRPKVYGIHRTANSVGQFIAPLAGGVIAAAFGWRVPFVVLVLPTIVFVLLSLRLREPVRGVHERRALGASDEVAETEEEPASFGEAWRTVWQIETARRIWYSLPFLAGALFGLGALLSVYYEEVWALGEAQRGVLFALVEPGQLVGVIVGIPIANRLMAHTPGRALKFLALVSVASGLLWILLATASSFPAAVTGHVLIAATLAVTGPGVLAVSSLVIPPRVRAIGFAVASLWVLPGLLILVLVGAAGDAWGIQGALLALVPIFVVGGLILSTAGKTVADDIARIRQSAVTRSEVAIARARGETKLLACRGLNAGYEGTQVLFDVDFEVDEGEIVALLGTNGAGKSTLLRTISGILEPWSGVVVLDGRDISSTPPEEVVRFGAVQVPGGKGVFPELTLRENLDLAGWTRPEDRRQDDLDHVFEFFPELADRLQEPAGNLSGGQQQMLTLSMAFLMKPRLLMIDELSLGLAPVIVERLIGIVRAMKQAGTTIVIVEQSVNVALTMAETAYFMEKGEIRFHGPTAELLERPDILRSVFLEGAASMADSSGEAVTAAPAARQPRDRVVSADVDLEVVNLAKSFGGNQATDDVSFELRQGQILGLIGPNGAGKTTLFDLISGFEIPDQGEVRFAGVDVTNWSPSQRAFVGLGRSFQDARLFPTLTVKEAVLAALERQAKARDILSASFDFVLPAVRDAEFRLSVRADDLVELMGLQAYAGKFIFELSTGTRRMVDLACVLAHQPRVIMFDEPSSGIAQRETEALGPVLERVRDELDASLLVIEHDMPLIQSIADEIIALDQGRVVTRGTPTEVLRHPAVVASYLGTDEAVINRSARSHDTGELAATSNTTGD